MPPPPANATNKSEDTAVAIKESASKKPVTAQPTKAGSTRPKMPISQRAKQFQPFAALSGLEEALARKEREIEEQQKARDGGLSLES